MYYIVFHISRQVNRTKTCKRNETDPLDMSMDNMPPEIIAEVFSYLTVEDLVQVQNVCTNWKEICQQPSIWKNAVYAPSDGTSCTEMESVLKQAPKIKEFLPPTRIGTSTLEVITEYCPEIKKLRLYVENETVSDLNYFFKHNTNIEELDFSPSNDESATYWKWLRYCNNLKALKLRYCSVIDFKIVANCSPSLKELDVQHITNYNHKNFTYLISKCGLVSLKMSITNENVFLLKYISTCDTLENLTVRIQNKLYKPYFLEFLPKLKDLYLKLYAWSSQHQVGCLFSKGQQSNVQRLKLKRCYLNKHILEAVCDGCPNLETLKISQCYGLRDEAFLLNCDFHHLNSLTLVECKEITDVAANRIRQWPNLRTVSFVDCPMVSSDMD